MAKTPHRAFMEDFKSSRILFPDDDSTYFKDNPGRYPAVLALLFNTFGWTPTGEGEIRSEECSPSVWQGHLQDPRVRSSVQMQGALIQKYFQQCEKELVTGPTSEFMNGLKMLTMKYNAKDNPFLSRVVFSLPGNVKLKGLLALKGDMKRRPLVIFRTGIFANVEEFIAERAWLMMLFEQSPFNVLLVENMSGSDFIANNKQLSFGGYDEGIQNILLARLVQDPMEPISRIVEDVHLFGVSLGGHGVLFASLLNKYNSSASRPLIKSFFAYCPVVNLQESMGHLTQSGWISKVVDVWAERRLTHLKKIYPDLKDFPAFHFLDAVVMKLVKTYRGGLSYVSSIRLPPGMVDGPDFWIMNDYWKFYKDVQEPVLIVATQQDPVVSFATNAQTLQNKKLKIDSKNVKVVDLPEGMHCTLPVVYDWQAVTSMMQGYVLSHSPEFKMRAQNLDMDMKEEWSADFFNSPVSAEFDLDWPKKDKGFVTLEIRARNQKGDKQDFNMSLPLSEFDFRFWNKEITKAEQQMMTRWLNQNLSVRIGIRDQKSLLRVSWPVAL
ncbi:Alpha/beta hydrolase family protein [compost metagenome]